MFDSIPPFTGGRNVDLFRFLCSMMAVLLKPESIGDAVSPTLRTGAHCSMAVLGRRRRILLRQHVAGRVLLSALYPPAINRSALLAVRPRFTLLPHQRPITLSAQPFRCPAYIAPFCVANAHTGLPLRPLRAPGVAPQQAQPCRSPRRGNVSSNRAVWLQFTGRRSTVGPVRLSTFSTLSALARVHVLYLPSFYSIVFHRLAISDRGAFRSQRVVSLAN